MELVIFAQFLEPLASSERGIFEVSSRWRIVDLVDYSGVITTNTGRLVVGKTEVPLSDVTCVLIGVSTRVSGAVLELCSRFDVPILSCDWRGVPFSCAYGWSDNSRVGARHRAQSELSSPRKKNAWMRLVKAKISGQIANLFPNSPARRILETHLANVRSGDPDNLEARAARSYWSAVFDDPTFSRSRDGGGRNDLLNYGYAVLRGTVVRGIYVAGLTPTLGIWHRNRSNVFALADDLIEPFRPAIDAVVRNLPADATLSDRAVKAELVGTLRRPFNTKGFTVSTAVSDVCQAFAGYAEGDHRTLTVESWGGLSG